jgi:hypothetical protein
MRKQIFALALLLFTPGAIYAQAMLKENPVLIAKQKSLVISGAALINDPVLTMPDAYKTYRITSFEVSYLPKGSDKDLLGPFKIKGNDMKTGVAAGILSRLSPGDKLFFDEIIAETNDAKQTWKLSAAVTVQ